MNSSSKEAGFPWEIGELPFFWGTLGEPTNGAPLPDTLPFTADLDATSFFIKQKSNPHTSHALDLAYRKGSQISGMMDDSGIGLQYAEDFLQFLVSVRGSENFKGCKVLEVGSGTGFLLHRLSSMGAEVTGIEPGDHGQLGKKKYGIPIVQDFFPTPQVTGKFDLIISYAVLEHLENPSEFLTHLSQFLSPKGKIALSVPNCEPYIKTGDLSMLLHEHWSYFTPLSLEVLLSKFWIGKPQIKLSGFGGSIYASTDSDSNHKNNISTDPSISKALSEIALRYRALASVGVQRMKSLLDSNSKNHLSTGIFVPGRAINTLALTCSNLENCRLFDDNPLLHGTYFPGFQNSIESREELLRRPTDVVVIMSHTFGNKIVSTLKPLLPATTRLVTWDELYS